MNPYESPRETREINDTDFVSVRTEPIPSNAFMAIFICGASIIPLSLGIVFLMMCVTNGLIPIQTRWTLGTVALLLVIFGIGLLGAALHLWRNRRTSQADRHE